MLNKLKLVREDRKKEAFYCSDHGKLDIELYYAFKGVPATNPPEWYETLKWGAGKGVETAMLDVLKENGVVDKDYDQKTHGRVEMIREGVQINGYIDAISQKNVLDVLEGCPIEIKSINNANKWDIEKYINMCPRENYVAQLATYMDFLGKDTGYLFVSAVDGLSRFWFECKRIKDRVYKCGNTEVDLDVSYRQWSVLYNDFYLKDIEPECPLRYKVPLNEVNWKELSKTDIAKARAGTKVVGDPDSWKITYSNWKDLIIKKQGVEVGYSPLELEMINNLTDGYTSKKWLE